MDDKKVFFRGCVEKSVTDARGNEESQWDTVGESSRQHLDRVSVH